MSKVWACHIGTLDDLELPEGADFPMRQAIEEAYAKLTGKAPQFIFSGWGAELNEQQLEVAAIKKRHLVQLEQEQIEHHDRQYKEWNS